MERVAVVKSSCDDGMDEGGLGSSWGKEVADAGRCDSDGDLSGGDAITDTAVPAGNAKKTAFFLARLLITPLLHCVRGKSFSLRRFLKEPAWATLPQCCQSCVRHPLQDVAQMWGSWDVQERL
ncbi:unnamed protein product [Lampetra planeri]